MVRMLPGDQSPFISLVYNLSIRTESNYETRLSMYLDLHKKELFVII